MKAQLRITRPNNSNHLNDAAGFRGFLLGNIRRKTALLASVATGVLCMAQTSPANPPQEIGAIFVIAMENHNFTQPPTQTSPQQIFGNPAAPFQNSLITPGNSNAAQVSCARAYFNAARAFTRPSRITSGLKRDRISASTPMQTPIRPTTMSMTFRI
jgi:hypothetical protein